MTSPAIPASLARAIEADVRMWDTRTPNAAAWLAMRNLAVAEAIADGCTVADIAGALCIRDSDVERILQEQMQPLSA